MSHQRPLLAGLILAMPLLPLALGQSVSPSQPTAAPIPSPVAESEQSDDNSKSPLIPESVLEGRRQTQEVSGKETGVEQDDPRARLEWQRLTYGAPSAAFTRQQMRIRRSGLHRDRGGRSAGSDADVPATSFSATSQPGSGPTWIPLGPADAEYEQNGRPNALARDSGRARAILPHPTDPDTLYFLTSGGGLWVTHNFTANIPTWVPLSDNLPTTGGGAVAFGRTPNVLYLGLGDPFDVINVGGAMVKSVDGGQTWTNFFELGSAQSVRDIKVDVSGNEDIVIVSTDTGVFRSADSGVSYPRIQGGTGELFEGKDFWHIVKTSAGYLVNGRPCTSIPAASACVSASSIFVSTDIGATWAAIPNGGTVFSGGRTTLAVSTPGDSVVYALASNAAGTAQQNVFRSTDGGLNWTALGVNSTKVPTNPNNNNPNMDITHAQAWYNQMILVDPRDATRNTLYIGGNLSSAKSTDGGATWTLLTDWAYGVNGVPYAHADFHTAAFSGAGTAKILFGNDGGLYLSTDDGLTWSSDKNRGLETFLLYSIIGTPRFPGAFIVGAQDNGTRIRKGNTKIFNQSIGGDGMGIGWGQANSTGGALGTVANSGYRRTINGQKPEFIETWENASPNFGQSVFFTPVETPRAAADPTGLVFYTNFSTLVVRTLDSGLFYGVIGQAGVGGIASGRTFRSQAHSVGIGPTDLLHVAVAGAGGNIVATTNGGTSWLDRSINTQLGSFLNISTLTWANSTTLFAASESPSAGVARIAKSTNAGDTWTRSDTGMPDGRVSRIVVDPRDNTNNTLYAGGDLGVFRSTDGGANWAPYGSGLPNVRVNDIYVPADGSYLAIATYGRGAWILPSLTYLSSTLMDDGLSCDHDGILDSGETGHLTITLHNGGLTSLSGITASVTSANASVIFPNGNSVSFSPAPANSDVSASLSIGMNAVAGIQAADLAIAFNDPALEASSAITALAQFRLNTDEAQNASASDDFEAIASAWSVDGTAVLVPNIFRWERRQITPLEHRWGVVDSNLASDQVLISPQMHVGSGSFSFSFERRYSFEFQSGTPNKYFDGLVLEISNNGGSSWSDIGAMATPTYDGPVDATAAGNVLLGRSVYGGRSASYPNFAPVTVNLGTQYANQDVRLRFRVGTDESGFSSGIEMRNFATNGITNTPFSRLTAHSAVCPSTTGLLSSQNPSTAGGSVTFTASVGGGVTSATGNVIFRDGNTTMGSVAASGNGQSQFSISSLAVGDHNITAEFSGDSGHAGSLSTTLVQTVNLTTTTTTLLSGQNPSTAGQDVTFAATVSGGVTPATGNVVFKEGTQVLATLALNPAAVSQFTAALATGSHSLTAEYSGDASHAASVSSNLNQTVQRAPTTTVLISSSNLWFMGQVLTFTATVNGGPLATGSIVFKEGSNTLATSPLNGSGSATYTTSSFTLGAHAITAEYAGDTEHTGSVAPSLSQQVGLAADVSPTVIQFGLFVLGRRSAAPFSVHNNTNAPLGMSWAASGDFVKGSGCDAPIAAGGTCNGEVLFQPSATGNRTGGVTFVSAPSYSVPEIALSGTGIDFALSLNRPHRTARDSQPIAPGATQIFEVNVVASSSLGDAAVKASCASNAALTTCRTAVEGMVVRVAVTNVSDQRASRLHRQATLRTMNTSVKVVVTVGGAAKTIDLPVALEVPR